MSPAPYIKAPTEEGWRRERERRGGWVSDEKGCAFNISGECSRTTERACLSGLILHMYTRAPPRLPFPHYFYLHYPAVTSCRWEFELPWLHSEARPFKVKSQMTESCWRLCGGAGQSDKEVIKSKERCRSLHQSQETCFRSFLAGNVTKKRLHTWVLNQRAGLPSAPVVQIKF